MTAVFFVTVLVAACVLLFLEWNRRDGRRRWLRLFATLLAVIALLLLAPRPEAPSPPVTALEGALWTPGSAPIDAKEAPMLCLALPGAVESAPKGSLTIPDVATLRRRFSDVATLQIFGNGPDAADLRALTGLRLVYHPPAQPVTQAPAVSFLRYPRELPLGEALVVDGRVAGLAVGALLPLSLEAPDGGRTEAATQPADGKGEAAFSLHAPALSATGRFVWQLRCGGSIETLGVSVVPPSLPRVLILESSPRFDTPGLRRWFEAAGGTMTTRTQVGKETFRVASTLGPAAQLAVVTNEALAEYDLLLADASALVSLHPDERAALAGAVEKGRLGLLVMADDSVFPSATAPLPADLLLLLPWKLVPGDDPSLKEDRLVRPAWPGQSSPSQIPVSSVPYLIQGIPHQTVLMDDRHDRVLAAASRLGGGQIAMTLVRDTMRWQRESDFGAFAAYWSHLLSRLSRPRVEISGRWSLVGGESGPVFVDHPIRLQWTGPPGGAPGAAAITDGANPVPITLPLRQDSRGSSGWEGTFWPRHAGWHRVTGPAGGATLDFFVDATGAWPVVENTHRRLATALFASPFPPLPAPAAPLPIGTAPISRGWWFALFLLAAGFLWAERRFGGPAPVAGL